ncbi:MAG: TonB-dependent receptor [Terriglobales bacterium]
MTGIVTDSSTAVLQNANLEIKDHSKGTVRSTKTDREGVYRFFFLAPDRYSITVTMPGFAAASRTVTIQVGQTASADFRLKVGSANTTVDVKADAAVLQTDKADLATVFSAVQLEDVPNPGNDLTAVAQTAPGAVMNTQKTGMRGAGNFATYGLPATSNLFTLDGMDQNDPVYNVTITGATGLTLGLNEVQEATVVNNGYSGQYGRFAGANVNYVTKSGANEFHGNALYWWNGRIINANDWFNKFVQPGCREIHGRAENR